MGQIQLVHEDSDEKEKQLIKAGFGKVQEEDAPEEIQIVKKTNEDGEDEYFSDYEDTDSYYAEEAEEKSEEESEKDEHPIEVMKPEPVEAEKPKQSLNSLLNAKNIDSTATHIALAQCFLSKRKTLELEESAYGKNFYYPESSEEDLPMWFRQDELANN